MMDDLGDYGESSGGNLFNAWEEESTSSVEQNSELEKQVNYEKDNCSQKLWQTFQNAACSVAQLYKDRESGMSVWIPFQNAAKNVTCLYQEGLEAQKRLSDICTQYGIHKRNKELLAWVKKKKRIILREDLISFITNNNPNACNNNNNNSPSYAHHYTYQYGTGRNTGWSTGQTRSSRHSPLEQSSGSRTPPNVNRLSISDSNPSAELEDRELETFREALAYSALGIRSQASPCSTAKRNISCGSVATGGVAINNGQRFSPNSVSGSNGSLTELSEFISNEFTRHVESRKRSISSDVIMDSPTHKRSKYA